MSAGSEGRASNVRAVLFDADRTDHEVVLSPTTVKGLDDRQLLWVDIIASSTDGSVREHLESIPADGTDVDRFLARSAGPRLELHGDYFALRVAAQGEDDRAAPVPLDLIAGRNYVVTVHPGPVPFLADFADRMEADTSLGMIDSGSFSAVLLDGLLTGYLRVADELEAAVDALDQEALKPNSTRDLLGDMVALRHRIAKARQRLASHREVFAAMARPDFEIVAEMDSWERFQPLATRCETAMSAIEDSREALVGTFDIYTSRTAQRTNNIVKVLTVVSVLLLPTTVVAGFMGMNIKAPYSNDDPTIFWYVIGAIAVIAITTIALLRLRRWL